MSEEGFYRLMHRADAPKLIGGTFKFGSFARYRDLEKEGDTHIGDAEEGLVHFDITDYFEAGSVDPRKLERLKSMRIDISPTAGHIVLEGNTSTYKADYYVFSFSYGKPGDLLDHFAKHNHWCAPYDCAVKLPDPAWLTKFINRTGRLATGASVRDSTETALCGKVQYRDNRFHYMADVPRTVVPLLKRPKYAGDNEYRIVLIPRGKWAQDNLFVTTNPPFGCMSVWEG